MPFNDNLWGIEIGNSLSGKGLIPVGNPGDMDSGESNPLAQCTVTVTLYEEPCPPGQQWVNQIRHAQCTAAIP